MSPRQNPSPRRPNRKDQARIERRRRAADIRRRQTVVTTTPQATPARSRRPIIIGAAVAAAIAIAAVVVVLVVVQDDDETTTIDPSLTAALSSTPGSGDWAISDVPDSYRIVYRNDRYVGTNVTTTTAEYTVRRPFESLVVTKIDAPPGGAVQSTFLNNYGTFVTKQGVTQTADEAAAATTAGATPAGSTPGSTTTAVPTTEPPRVFDRLPIIAYDDIRLDVSLPDLVADGIYVPRERRTLLGRECQVFRTGDGVESRAAAKPSGADYTDACIDASGLLLEQVSIASGQVIAHLTAVEIDTTIEPGDDVFAVSAESSPPDEGGSVTDEIGLDEVPVPTYWVPEAAPAGYEHRGRYAMEQVQLDSSGAAVTNEDGTSKMVTSYADVYVSGTKTIVVTQGPAAARESSIADNGTSTRLGGLGVAQTASGPQGAAVVARPGNPSGWFVKIDATMSTDELNAFARTMHTVEGPPAPVETVPTSTVPISAVPTSTAPA